MRRLPFSTLAVALLGLSITLTVGCGGGGGGNGGGPGPIPGDIVLRSVAVTGTNSNVSRSLTYLQVGQEVLVRMVVVDEDGVSTFIEPEGVTINTAPGVATLSGNQLTAIGEGTGSITATSGGQLFTVPFSVTNSAATVAGRVRTDAANDSGAAALPVRFLDVSNTLVSEVVTGPDGRFQANVPASAVKFVVDTSPRSGTFYNQFGYGAQEYSAAIDGCGAALPATTPGGTTSLPQEPLVRRKLGTVPPPPPPSGCGG